jgi:1-deoxy-D-xylulose-5-phosphate reductoisomerase
MHCCSPFGRRTAKGGGSRSSARPGHRKTAQRVVARHPDRFRRGAHGQYGNATRCCMRGETWQPAYVGLVEPNGSRADRAAGCRARVPRRGRDASRRDIVLNAVVGAAGLDATLAALEKQGSAWRSRTRSRSCGGRARAARRAGPRWRGDPVDSEHSALLQCLAGARGRREVLPVQASGVPHGFRRAVPGVGAASASQRRVRDALNHPTWAWGGRSPSTARRSRTRRSR